MAQQQVNIGGFGPFLYEDTEEKAISTEGDIEAGNIITSGLSTNSRLTFSDTDKVIKEVNDLSVFILSGHGIDVVDELDGTVSVDLIAILDDILDVTITSEAAADMLIRNAANTQWVNHRAVKNIDIAFADSPYTLVATETLKIHLFCDCTNGDITVNLPPVAGLEYVDIFITKNDVVANNVTINADGSETINGSASLILNTQWESVLLFTEGTQWYAQVS